MISSITLYPKSFDPKKMEELLSKQVGSMKSAKGLLKIRVSKDHLMSPGGPSTFGKVMESSWESLEDFMAWVQTRTPEENADKDYMLENGAVLLFYEVEEI